MGEEPVADRRRGDERGADRPDPLFSPVEAFLAGRPSIQPFEVDELGPLDGMRVVHLQCRQGLDTLDLARLHPTVRVTGLDRSALAVDQAGRLAAEVRVADRADFVQGDVLHATDALEGRRYDLVYTGKGALSALPDLDAWAAVVHQLLVPGGALYLTEQHPVASVLASDRPVPALDYFAAGPQGPGSGWTHPVGRVISAVLRAGLTVELFHEWDFALSRELPYLVMGTDGRARWPGPGSLPLLYSLKARRPLP